MDYRVTWPRWWTSAAVASCSMWCSMWCSMQGRLIKWTLEMFVEVAHYSGIYNILQIVRLLSYHTLSFGKIGTGRITCFKNLVVFNKPVWDDLTSAIRDAPLLEMAISRHIEKYQTKSVFLSAWKMLSFNLTAVPHLLQSCLLYLQQWLCPYVIGYMLSGH